MRQLRAGNFEVTRVDVVSLARVLAASSGLWALLMATLGAALADIFSPVPPDTLRAALMDVLLYMAGAYLLGTVYGGVYNLAARYGGLELELRPVVVQEQIAGAHDEPAGTTAENRRDRMWMAVRRERLLLWAYLALPAAGLAWLVLMLPVHEAQRQAHEAAQLLDRAATGRETKAACVRCLDVTSRCRVLSLLYPRQRAYLRQARARATLRLAEVCAVEGRWLPAALLAADYLQTTPNHEAQGRARWLLERARARGVTETQLAAARSLRTWPEKLTWHLTPTGEKLQRLELAATCTFRCRGPLGVAASRHLIEAPRWGACRELEIGPLQPGQQVQGHVRWSDLQAREGARVGRGDLIILPLHITPAPKAP